MTTGWVRSPRALGFDHSLSRAAGEAPEPPRVARDGPGGLSAVGSLPLAFFSKMGGYAWALVIPFGCIVVCLIWRKLSGGCARVHPPGVAPEALEG
jgi:hypothetical protein